MIACEEHKVVFVDIPKTGSRSIMITLRAQYGGTSIGKNHARSIPQQYKDYFKFCVVRNPYERMCSLYWSLCRRRDDTKSYRKMLKEQNLSLSLEGFLTLIKSNSGKALYFPQYKFVENNNMDTILRFENLNEEFNMLPFIKAPHKLPHSNSTTINRNKVSTPDPRPHWRELVTAQAAEIINERYAKDFEMFNYEMENF